MASRAATSFDSVFSRADQREILGLTEATFGLGGLFLQGVELQDFVRSGAIRCPRARLLGCASECCFAPPRAARIEGGVYRCHEGLSFCAFPLEVADELLALYQVGPYFETPELRNSCFREHCHWEALADRLPVFENAEQGACALLRQWVVDRVQANHRREELALKETLLLFLVDSSRNISTLADRRELLDYLSEISTHMTNADKGFIMVLDEGAETLRIESACGVDGSFKSNVQLQLGEGVSGWVVQHGLPLAIRDTDADRRYREIGYRAGSELAVPIRTADRIIGVLVVDAAAKGAFSEFDQQLLESLANQVAKVLEAVDAHEDSEVRVRQLEALHDVGRAIGETLNLSDVLERVVETTSAVFRSTGTAILLRRDEGNELFVKAPETPARRIVDYDLASDHGVFAWVIQNADRLLINSGDDALFAQFRQYIEAGTHSVMCVPLDVHGQLLGAVLVSSSVPGCRYRDEDLALLSTIATSVGQAVHNAQLFEKGERQIAELSLINELGKALSSTLDLDAVLHYIVDMISSIVEAERGSLMLLDPESQTLRIAVCKGMERRYADDIQFALGEGVAGRVAETKVPLILGDTREDPRYVDKGEDRKALTLICAPIVNKDQVLGVLNCERSLGSRSFCKEDLNLLTTLASHAGIAIENARIYGQMIGVYFETIRSLANALEAKDPYTHGHSRRVAKDAVRIAAQLRLPRKKIENLRHAALLHDIGKIGIRDAILFKPGRLTEDEFAQIRQHPALGAGMVEPIEFLKDVSDVIRHHHERWDGKGFPDGLAGEEIPLGARIVCIADAFDAMTSTRPYREGMSIPVAVEELLRCRGGQFDPEIVDCFIAQLYRLHPSLAGRVKHPEAARFGRGAPPRSLPTHPEA